MGRPAAKRTPPLRKVTPEEMQGERSPYVLVAVPARPATPDVFLQMSQRLYDSLSYPRRERALCNEAVPSLPGKYGGHAAQRNRLIEKHLKAHHTHVLMMDVDLVRAPADLIEQLLAVSDEDIVAPHIYVERMEANKPTSLRNGGWFYDTGAFVQHGKTRHMWAPDLPGVQEMESVGCCYLIPANVYRVGGVYEPVGDEIEHLSLMRQAREMGYRVLAAEHITVLHAHLPKYGEAWHS
jgi:GT2 family glycosyltransferase